MRYSNSIYLYAIVLTLSLAACGGAPHERKSAVAADSSSRVMPAGSMPMVVDTIISSQHVAKPALNKDAVRISMAADSLFIAQHGQSEKRNVRRHAAILEVPSGAVEVAVQLRIEPLGSIDLPPLDPGMVNVTTLEGGFRFLPHGTQFAQPATVGITYDSTLIPQGYTVEDMRTFYYDEELESWQMLPKDTLREGMLLAYTTHFTDMINGILKVPENPVTSAYTPTSISELKAADPSAGVSLMSPPEASGSGAAALQYPLQLPAGRGGLTPNLALSYSSEGGNGWVGHGWGLSAPSITVETRWGVPRYLSDKESETYVLDGGQLSPVAHRSEFEVRRAGSKRFYPRVEGAFSCIERHGSSPATYRWEVTATNGARSFYGGTPEEGILQDAVLADRDGNIAQWSLVEVRDLNGNRMRYRYHKETSAFAGSGEFMQQQVLQSVEYAAHGNEAAPYRVEFSTHSSRADAQVNARMGFLQGENVLLDEVRVFALDSLVRSYRMNYTTGAYGKTLLAGVDTYNSQNELFYAHAFGYYNDVDSVAPYGDEEAYSTPSENLDGDFINPIKAFGDHLSALGGTTSWGASGGGGVGIGSIFGNGLTFTVGGNYGYSHGETAGAVSLIDLNGDGIPDKLYNKDRKLYYRPGKSDDGQFFGEAVQLSGAPSGFLRSRSTSNSTGFSANAMVSVGWSKSWTTSKTDVYLSDFNSDGLPDIAFRGSVYFNRLVNGHPTFEPTSSNTYNPIPASGSIDLSLLPDPAEETAEQKERNPLHNSVRMWRAPYGGTIRVNAPVQLMAALDPTVDGYDTRDGVRAALEFRNSVKWSVVIGADDLTPRSCNLTLNVTAGDELYFRLQSIVNGACDRVQWQPEVEYTAMNGAALWEVDPDGKKYSYYSVANDFLLSGNQPLALQKNGTVEVSIPFAKPATSDSVWLRVYAITANDTTRVLYREYALAPGQVVDTAYTWSMGVSKEQQLMFSLFSPTRLAWEDIACSPVVIYTAINDTVPVAVRAADNTPLYRYPAAVEHNTYSAAAAPVSAYLPDDATSELRIQPLLYFRDSLKAAGKFTFSVKGRDTLYARRNYTTNLAQVKGLGTEIHFYPDVQDTLVVHPRKGDALYVEYHFDSVAYGKEAKAFSYKYRRVDTAGNVYSNAYGNAGAYLLNTSSWYGSMHRGWGQFSYNEKAEYSTACMDMSAVRSDIAKLEVELKIPSDPSSMSESQLRDLESRMYNANTARYLLMAPDAAAVSYVGYDAHVTLGKSHQSTSRMGMQDVVVLPFEMASGRVPAATKQMKSENSTTSFGASAGPVGATHMRSKSETRSQTDMLDLNGDSYPDLISGGSVQYTNVLGGLEETKVHGFSTLMSKAEGDGMGVDAHDMPSKSSNTGPNSAKSQSAMLEAAKSISLSGNVGSSTDRAEVEWVDVNGDGLPDRAYPDATVELNMGYRFTERIPWETLLTRGHTNDYGAGMGVAPYPGYSAGVGLSRSENFGHTAMMDINGDGLPDLVQALPVDTVTVRYGTGMGFAPPRLLNVNPLQQGVGTGESANGSFSIPIPVNLIFISFRIAININAAAQHGVGREKVALRDMNGDGVPDYVYSDSEGELKVRYAASGRVNLLRTVQQPMGSTIALDYTRTVPTTDDPNARWTLSRVEVNDGLSGDGADRQLTTYAYHNSMYDRYERAALGFATVTATRHDTQRGNASYTRTVQRYHNTDLYRQGLLWESCTLTAAGDTLARTLSTYQTIDPATMAPQAPTRFYHGRLWPALAQSVEYTHEQGGALAMQKQYTYDAYGNVEKYVEIPMESPTEQITVGVSYKHDPARYLHTLPEKIEVGSGSTVLRHRTAIYDERGNLTQLTQQLSDSQSAVMDFEYDAYGNTTRVTRPANYRGQRLWYAIAYDSLLHALPTCVTDAYGYQSTTTYSYRWSMPLRATDINGTTLGYTYDACGRQASVALDVGSNPNQLRGSGYDSTLMEFTYHPNAAVAYATTTHHTPEGSVRTYTFTDGLARPVQVKKTGVVADDLSPNPSPQERGVCLPLSAASGGAPVGGKSLSCGEGFRERSVMIISGKQLYDPFGRVTAAYQPTTEPPGAEAEYNPTPDTVPPTRTTYDAKGRALTQTLPDGAVSSTQYTTRLTDAAGQVGNRQYGVALITTTTDPLGRVSHTATNLRGHTLQTLRESEGGNVLTRFEYNPLGELLQVTDPKGHTSHVTYDMVGRTLSTLHPDAGLTTMEYDPAGNLTKKVTQDLATTLTDGAGITYTYHYERCHEVVYPKYLYNRVTYTYGEPGATQGRAGRITLVQDATGGQEFYYDALGNVTKTIRSVLASQSDVYTYVYGATYDPWGRLREQVYPDGEKVTYTYNPAGQLTAFSGEKAGRTYSYLEARAYDKQDHTLYQRLGNGTTHCYTYDSRRQRLQRVQLHLSPADGGGSDVQYTYAYDAVDNILGIESDTTNYHAYTYDDLNRLIAATGAARGASYTLGMQYDLMGNPTRKTQATQGSQAPSHSWQYLYNGPTPNAVAQVGTRTYTYDANGNPTTWEDGTRYRRMAWDEENRLAAVEDNAYLSRYTYDHAGERVVKTHGGTSAISINGVAQGVLTRGEQATLYVSPYFTVGKGGAEFTKHYYAGAQRLVSKLGNGSFNNRFRPAVYGVTAGSINYLERVNSISQSREEYIKSLGVAPGPPHMQGIYATPDETGLSYPDGGTPATTYVPPGWPRKVVPLEDKDPNGPPGAPIQFYEPLSNEEIEPGFGFEGSGHVEEMGRYFYHSDHLGSTAYVTNFKGQVSQYVAYMPYGEALFEQHSNTRDMPYKFNGKIKDEETGLYYYGARYYGPFIPIWLGVDPLWMKHPDISSYVYCAGNPVRLVDPDGQDWFENEQTGSVYYNSAMGKNDAGKGAMASEGWKHFGKNGMFTQKDGVTGSDVQLATQNGGEITTGPSGSLTDGSMSTNVTMSMMLEGGGEAENFMSGQGYDKLPTQHTEYSKESEGRYPMGGGRHLSITFGKKIQINEKYGYFKKGSTKSSSGKLGSLPGSSNFLLGVERVDRKFTKYSSSKMRSFMDGFASFYNGMSGEHDYTNTQVYNSWGEYPNNNSTINDFRIQYGTK